MDDASRTRNVLITGACSGLGFTFLKKYALDTSLNIIATDRNPLPPDLLDVDRQGISWFTVDLTSEEDVHRFADRFDGDESSLDMVIHCAGIRGLVDEVEKEHPDNVAACETLEAMNLETLMKTFHVNAAGTFLLLRALVPSLRRSRFDPKVVVMSSRMGSVGHNTTGGAYAYRASKAALNSMIRSLSVDVPEVSFILCHPGRVETKLVRYREEGAISADECVLGLLPLIEKWGKKDSGHFYDRFGDPIEW